MAPGPPVVLRSSTRVVSIIGGVLMLVGGLGALFGYPWGKAISPFFFILPGVVLTFVGASMQKADRARG